MHFTAAEETVLEVLHTFTTKVFKQSLVGMHQTTLDGISLNMVLSHMFDNRGHAETYSDVMKSLLKMQWLVFVVDSNYPNGRWGLNRLCTCGRCNSYTPRTRTVKKVTPSLEGFTAAFFKGMRKNKPFIAQPARVDEKRYARSKSSMKFNTAKYSAKVWNEAVSGIQHEEEMRRKRLVKLMDRVTLELAEMS
jgi:hypothetical protein